MVDLARHFGLGVVAEGVENEMHARDLLDEMGCDMGQGFLFSRPLSVGPAGGLVRGPGVARAEPARGEVRRLRAVAN